MFRGSFCGSGFFLPELRSGEGLAREVEGDGEGVRLGAGDGELRRDPPVEGRIWVVVVVSAVERESVGGGVFADTIPGIFATKKKSERLKLFKRRERKEEIKEQGG